MRICAVVLAACAVGPHERTVVRRAGPGDVLPEPPPLPQPAHGHRARLVRCEPRGRPARQFYEPVVAFVRTQFLESERGRAYLATGVAFAQPRDGVEVQIDPRDDIGLVRIAIKAGRWDAGSYYCLHVRREGSRITIVVHDGGSWIK